MKVSYLIYNERPNSGLMNSQVIGLLKELSKNRDLDISLVSIWQPWVYLKMLKEIRYLKNELKIYNIKLRSLPFGLPGRYFFSNEFLLKINIYYIYLLLKLFNLHEYEVVHCRGYFITYIAALLKKNYKLIFDMRSLFPEENISAGKWRKSDSIYSKWKDIEKATIEKSEVVIGVSLPMVNAISIEYQAKNIKYIPIGYSSKGFIRDENQREQIRASLNIQDRIVIVYAGSLEFGFWNDIRVYVRYFSYINSIINDAHFLILTGSSHQVIGGVLKENGIENFSLKSLSPKEVPGWLAVGDIGIQVMDKMSDSETRFGVKTVEYLAMGIPVITNSNVGGIVDFIKKNNLGVIYDDGNSQGNLVKLLKTSQNYEGRCLEYAKNNFEMRIISNMYLELYKNICS